MVGWTAHTAGRVDRAYSHFLRAFHLSQAGHVRQLGAHVLELHRSSQTRSNAFGQLFLITFLIEQDEPEKLHRRGPRAWHMHLAKGNVTRQRKGWR